MKIASRIKKKFAAEAKAEQVVLEVIWVAQVDSQVTGVYDMLDWIARVTRIARIARVTGVIGINRVVKVDGIVDRVNIYRVNNFLLMGYIGCRVADY